MNPRITQKDIAREAGVDASTVSLALSGHPRIPEATRSRIQAIAEKLGYRPDPAFAGIAAARWKGRRDARGTTLAFLVDNLSTAEIELKLYLQGVRQQADLLGYRVEPFSLCKYPSPKALLHVIRARGIRGVVVGQSRQMIPPELFHSSPVPIVQCGFLSGVEGEVVRPDLRLAVTKTLAQLQPEYRRILCILPIEKSLHSDGIILGTVLAEAKRFPRGRIRTVVTASAPTRVQIQALRKLNPDVIVTINEKHKALLRASVQCPILTLHTLPPFEEKQGVDLRLVETGRASVNLLEMKMRNLPMTTAPYRQTLLIEPRLIGMDHGN